MSFGEGKPEHEADTNMTERMNIMATNYLETVRDGSKVLKTGTITLQQSQEHELIIFSHSQHKLLGAQTLCRHQNNATAKAARGVGIYLNQNKQGHNPSDIAELKTTIQSFLYGCPARANLHLPFSSIAEKAIKQATTSASVNTHKPDEMARARATALLTLAQSLLQTG